MTATAVHDDSSGGGSVRRYEPAHRVRRPAPVVALDHLLSVASAPLGRPRLFPALLRRAADRLRADPWAASLRVGPALAYYGEGLSLRVPPQTVTRRLTDHVRDARGPRWTGASFLDNADWSAALLPVEQCQVHVEMTQLIEADLDWRATLSYRRAKKAAQQGRPVHRSGRPLATPDELKAYYRRCVDLVRSVRKHGLLDRDAQRALGFARESHGRFRRPEAEWTERGIGMAIDADGRLVRHLGGRHRWAAASALGLPEALVEVRLVHLAWLERMVERTGEPPHLALRTGLAALGDAS